MRRAFHSVVSSRVMCTQKGRNAQGMQQITGARGHVALVTSCIIVCKQSLGGGQLLGNNPATCRK